MGVQTTGATGVPRAADPIEARVRQIRDWLVVRVDVARSVAGPLVDRWRGPDDGWETIDARLPGG
jgi:hypothetical protein